MNYLALDKVLSIRKSISGGTSIRTIASNLGISTNTVKKYSNLEVSTALCPTSKKVKKKIVEDIVITKIVNTGFSTNLCSKDTKECLLCRFKKYCIDTGTKIFLASILVSVTNKQLVPDLGTKSFYRRLSKDSYS